MRGETGSKSKLSIIIPCYFNAGNILPTTQELLRLERAMKADFDFEYIFVDDGSKDETHLELKKFYESYPSKVKVIKLTRNFGANNASFAGMHFATGDCCIFLAADLQDPPELIRKMTDHWKSGYKLVIANRTNREESLFQKLFSNTYHYLMRKYAFPEAPAGGFDLILFDSQLRTDILRLNERNLNLPYLFIWLGYEFVTVPYIRQKREIGKSRWTFSKKLTAFADAFCGFTYFPIRMISILGGICALIAVIYAMVIVVTAFISGSPVPGWASLMTVILFVSALQFVSIGILGEYLWRTLASTRVRPNFVVDNVLSQGMPSPRPLDPLAWSKADSLTPEHSRNQIPL